MIPHRLQNASMVWLLSGLLWACATTPRPAPVKVPVPEPDARLLAQPVCPGPVAEDPNATYKLGRQLVESSMSEKYRGGLTYQAGIEHLLEAARAGHADAQYLYGWRLLLDAAERRAPQESDAEERAIYVQAIVYLSLAAQQEQIDAVAFFPAVVREALWAPLSGYEAAAEMDGTPFETIPAPWVEAARLALHEVRACVQPLRTATVSDAALPKAPRGFVSIPAGRFVAGPIDLSPQTDALSLRDQPLRVTLTRSLYVQATEVTRAQWKTTMGRLPKGLPSCEGELCPVSAVSWVDAVKYVNKLSKREKLESCYRVKGKDVSFMGLECTGYRLPTDAEWEFVARAGLGGERYGLLADIATTGAVEGPNRVGSRAANPWGLYDTLGNVSEWCHDLYERHRAADVVDPLGTRFGVNRVARGGSFASKASQARFSARQSVAPRVSLPTLGLRPVRTIPSSP